MGCINSLSISRWRCFQCSIKFDISSSPHGRKWPSILKNKLLNYQRIRISGRQGGNMSWNSMHSEKEDHLLSELKALWYVRDIKWQPAPLIPPRIGTLVCTALQLSSLCLTGPYGSVSVALNMGGSTPACSWGRFEHLARRNANISLTRFIRQTRGSKWVNVGQEKGLIGISMLLCLW